jgi:hypothetical protein
MANSQKSISSPFDGLEALTPLPQGDVSLEQIKEHIGDKVLLDGIPAVLFLPTYTCEKLMETVEQIVDLFHPRLVLGVSDEVPQGAEAGGAIKKLKMVAEWCQKYHAQVASTVYQADMPPSTGRLMPVT